MFRKRFRPYARLPGSSTPERKRFRELTMRGSGRPLQSRGSSPAGRLNTSGVCVAAPGRGYAGEMGPLTRSNARLRASCGTGAGQWPLCRTVATLFGSREVAKCSAAEMREGSFKSATSQRNDGQAGSGCGGCGEPPRTSLGGERPGAKASLRRSAALTPYAWVPNSLDFAHRSGCAVLSGQEAHFWTDVQFPWPSDAQA
jgi:hypothetical protein